MHIAALEELIDDLNAQVWESLEEGDWRKLRFTLVTDGGSHAVEFMGECLWDSENDLRESDELGREEPLGSYLLREAIKLICSAASIWEHKITRNSDGTFGLLEDDEEE